MTEPVLCQKCKGQGFHAPSQQIESGILSSICRRCGFQALGMTQVKQFEKRGGYCRECSGDYG